MECRQHVPGGEGQPIQVPDYRLSRPSGQLPSRCFGIQAVLGNLEYGMGLSWGWLCVATLVIHISHWVDLSVESVFVCVWGGALPGSLTQA
jgi:hypothetical protein